jgi:hypothetical protein
MRRRPAGPAEFVSGKGADRTIGVCGRNFLA